ncbi:hypothetical protein QCA50_003221 [Cerrena zonata]|uniref:Uncharacterized protein n=1 Tax=Cerrena zonata TaxID=2478898 RepID=A0AAW0GLZ4_9APHY
MDSDVMLAGRKKLRWTGVVLTDVLVPVSAPPVSHPQPLRTVPRSSSYSRRSLAASALVDAHRPPLIVPDKASVIVAYSLGPPVPVTCACRHSSVLPPISSCPHSDPRLHFISSLFH